MTFAAKVLSIVNGSVLIIIVIHIFANRVECAWAVSWNHVLSITGVPLLRWYLLRVVLGRFIIDRLRADTHVGHGGDTIKHGQMRVGRAEGGARVDGRVGSGVHGVSLYARTCIAADHCKPRPRMRPSTRPELC